MGYTIADNDFSMTRSTMTSRVRGRLGGGDSDCFLLGDLDPSPFALYVDIFSGNTQPRL